MCFPVSLERILDECPASRIFNLLPDPIIFQLNPKLESHLFPIKHQLLEKNPNLIVHCCDFSPRAIELVKASFTLFSSLADSPTIFHFSKMTFSQFPLSPCIQSHPSYDPSRVHAFVHDLTSSPSLLPSILSSSSLPSHFHFLHFRPLSDSSNPTSLNSTDFSRSITRRWFTFIQRLRLWRFGSD